MTESKKVKYNIVNEEGAIINQVFENDDVRILRENSLKKLKGETELNKKEEFIKIFVKPLLHLSQVLSNAESWFITYLLQFLDFKSGVLKDENDKLVTVNFIIKDSELGQSTVYNLLKKLRDKGIISISTTEEQECFVMNPYIFMKGQTVNNTLIDLFKETKWAELFKK
jgi:DNA-binding transcriptional ArsR family regulator